MSSGKEKWTARGTGKCSNCSSTYSRFRKPANCLNCNFFIGGKYVPKETTSKKRKLDNPLAVTVCSFEGNTLFSIKVSTKDDRCFLLVSDTSRLCYYRSCKNLRSVSVASGQHRLDKLQCEHLNKVKESANAKAEFYLTSDKLNDYPGSSEIQSTMEAALKYADHLGVPQVVRVSEMSYVVCGIPDTYAESGFVHVKTVESRLHCTVSNWHVLVGGKQLKVRSICLHAHLLTCCLGLWKSPPTQEQKETATTSATSAVSDHESESASSVSRFP